MIVLSQSLLKGHCEDCFTAVIARSLVSLRLVRPKRQELFLNSTALSEFTKAHWECEEGVEARECDGGAGKVERGEKKIKQKRKTSPPR